MKRNLLAVVLIALVFSLSVTFLTGCAKKAGLKEQAVMTQEQRPAAAPPSMAKPTPQDDAAARERALREQALREQAERERAAREAAERAKKDAAAKSGGDSQRAPDPGYQF